MSRLDGPEVHTPPRRGRRIALFVGGLLLLSLGVVVALYLCALRAADREVEEAVAEIDRDDPGWRLEDLDRQRPAVPDEKNGALQVAAARRLMPASWPTSPAPGRPSLDDLLAGLEPQQPLNEQQRRELRAQLQAVQPALKKAEDLVDLPEGRYALSWPLGFIGARIDPVYDARTVARLLQLEAMRQAQDGDADGACRTEVALVNAGRSIGDEYTLIVLLNRTGVGAIATETAERLLAQGEPGEASLAAAQRALEREEAELPAGVVMAFRGERALSHRMMQAMEDGRLSLSASGGTPSLGERFSDLVNTGMVRHSHAVYLRYMTEAIRLARAPGPEQIARRKELLTAPVDRRAALAALMMPAADKVLGAEWRQLARLRCAVAAVAAERYRRAHGRWPESLEALVPAYLARVPADPYDGKPLRLRRLDDGVVIYSVGPDQTDNGGKIDRKDPLAEGNDLGFRLWDVARRRQPAPLPPLPQQPPPEEGR
jgi:hypothetical protein